MKFIYNFDQQHDTIAAIATPPGEGAISIIRISGKDAISVFDKIFSKKTSQMVSHSVHFGKILDPQDKNKVVDTVLAFIMKAPKSYTGENSVEINCHGGTLITKKVFQRILEAGARAALPGEFTLRAFLNNKIDLAQAEAIQTLISAQNELALKAAKEQLEGRLSQEIQTIQKELIETAAVLEAWVDFPEEGLEFQTMKELKQHLLTTLIRMQKLAASFERGKKLTDGIQLTIIGTPNVGKSSLMNALCQKEKSIVTDIPGTTRDLIEEKILLGSLHFHLTDTAGIRKTDQTVEQEGVRRSEKALKKADLTLLILDASRELNTDDQTLLKTVDKAKTIVIWNKIDLNPAPKKIGFPHELLLSLKNEISLKKNSSEIKEKGLKAKEKNSKANDLEEQGLEELIQTIEKLAWQKSESKEEIILTKERHKNALGKAIENCQKAVYGLEQKSSAEFVAADMRFALSALGQIIGHDLSEDILSEIFSKFCVGK